MTSSRLLLVVVAIYAVLALSYVYATPPWQNPDEPAHYNYAREIADEARLPVLEPGDYNQAELEALTSSKFANNPDVSRIRYESYQPPLYYAIGGVLVAAVPGTARDLYALRIFSVVCGALTLIAIYAIGREIFPDDPIVALGAAALVAFIPQHIAVSAAANNDMLGELLLSLIVLAGIRRVKGLPVRSFILSGGLLLGLAFLTKVTAYTGLALLLAAEVGWRRLRRERVAARPGVGVAVLALALAVSGWWFVRNAVVYGWPDVLGTGRHDQVVVGQLQPLWSWETVRALVATTFKSFWGFFGWMGVPIDSRIYSLLFLLTAALAAGLLVFAARRWRSLCDWQRLSLGLLALQFVLVAGIFALYNLKFVQYQGRYLFPASAALGVFWAVGAREMISRPRLLAALIVVGCAVLSVLGGGKLVLAAGAAAALAILGAHMGGRGQEEALLWVMLCAALIVLDVVCLLVYIVPGLS